MTSAAVPAAGYTSVHQAALAAWDAGLCPVQATTNGQKRPQGAWQEWQTRRPPRTTVDQWFATGWPGLGIICGSVSGNLEMLEFEGAAMADGLWDRYGDACDAAGLTSVLDRVASGYGEETPSGGIHMLLRVDGGPALGNTKLAHDADGKVTIETRGEGGFVIVAPSNGPTHPSGKPWEAVVGSFATIATVTADERDALYAVARTLDARPAPKPAPAPPPPATLGTRLTGDRWMDELVAGLAREPWSAILGRYGWTHSHDTNGTGYWVRPGKDIRDGHGATTNALGTDRLIVFTSNPGTVHLEPYTGTGQAPSYDRLDVIAAYDHAGDRIAAARRLAHRDTPKPRTPPPGIDPDTGEVTGRLLDDDFWTARPALTHIRDAARSRLVAPAAVLGCVLARVAAFTPPSTCLPPLIGSHAPLSLYVALRGRSGAGKSSPVACATDLLPAIPPGCIGPLGLGSGEGLVEAYMDLVEDTDGDGKKRRVKRQVRHGALFTLDEGQALAEMSSRKGSTILPVLRTAWSGGDPGQANASIETRRSLHPGSYHVGLISLWQDHAAGQLLGDADGGTPQRFVWLTTDDPDATDDGPAWPGELPWEAPAGIMLDGRWMRNPLRISPSIADEIIAARVAELRGDTEVGQLDSHRRLNKLKVAGALSVLDRRHEITDDDWALAEVIMSASDSVRDWILFENRRAAEQRDAMSATKAAEREHKVEQVAASRSLDAALRAIAKVAARHDKFTKRHVMQAIASRDRHRVTVDDVLDRAEREGLISRLDDGSWTAKACG